MKYVDFQIGAVLKLRFSETIGIVLFSARDGRSFFLILDGDAWVRSGQCCRYRFYPEDQRIA